MAIEKRISQAGKTTHRPRLRVRGYPEVSATFARVSDAREFEAQARVQMRGGQWGAHSEAKRHGLADAIDRYLAVLPSLQLKDERNRRRHAHWWGDRLGDMALADVAPPCLSAVRDELLVEPRIARGEGAVRPRRDGDDWLRKIEGCCL